MMIEPGDDLRHLGTELQEYGRSHRCDGWIRARLRHAFFLALVVSTGAVAQVPQGPPSGQAAAVGNPESQNEGGLQEVVVTANKRRENIQDVPIAISAISESDLAARGIQNTQDIAAAIRCRHVSRHMTAFNVTAFNGRRAGLFQFVFSNCIDLSRRWLTGRSCRSRITALSRYRGMSLQL